MAEERPMHNSLETALASLDALQDQIDILITQYAYLKAEHVRTAAILATFYEAPHTLSSLQPVLDLAVELNPHLQPNGK